MALVHFYYNIEFTESTFQNWLWYRSCLNCSAVDLTLDVILGVTQAHASFNMGWAYQAGDGVPQDLFLAKRSYDEAYNANQRQSWGPVFLVSTVII